MGRATSRVVAIACGAAFWIAIAWPAVAAAAPPLAPGEILATGNPGLVRIDPATGAQTLVTSLPLGPSLAVDADGSVVAAYGNAGIVRVDPTTGSATILTSGGLITGSISAIAIAPDRSILVTNYDGDDAPSSLVRVDPVTGAQHAVRQPNGRSPVEKPLGVGVADNGDIFVSEYFDRILRISPSGTIVQQIPLTDFGTPDELALDVDGTLYVVDFAWHGVHRVDPASGTNQLVFEIASGLGGGIALEADGKILVNGFQGGVPGIYRVDPADWTLTTVASGGLFGTLPFRSVVVVGEPPACRNGLDDDGDGLVDHPEDAGCAGPLSDTESPECNDGLDNDGDGVADHPLDGDCSAPSDSDEQPACSDGRDNDGDALVDYPADGECSAPDDPIEATVCADGLDNDGDGLVDYPADPGCSGLYGKVDEAPECNDGLDNDGDGGIDFDGSPPDPDCTSGWRFSGEKTPTACGVGGELVLVLGIVWRAGRRIRAGGAKP